MTGGLCNLGAKGAVFRDQLFLVGKRLLMANQGKLPETKYSLGGLPRCSRDGWGEGLGQRATAGWWRACSTLQSVVGFGAVLFSGQRVAKERTAGRQEGEEGLPGRLKGVHL